VGKLLAVWAAELPDCTLQQTTAAKDGGNTCMAGMKNFVVIILASSVQ